jgi:hypothetical protein
MPPTREYTGNSVTYYTVAIKQPTTPGSPPYNAECNDIIEALGMNFAEGNAFKALWRMAAARMGKQKEGYKDGVYDAEKVVFFGQRLVEQYKGKQNVLSPVNSPSPGSYIPVSESQMAYMVDQSRRNPFPNHVPGRPSVGFYPDGQ